MPLGHAAPKRSRLANPLQMPDHGEKAEIYLSRNAIAGIREWAKKKPPKPLYPVREKTATAATGRWNTRYSTIYPAGMSIKIFSAIAKFLCNSPSKQLYCLAEKLSRYIMRIGTGRTPNCLLISNSRTNSACSGK